MAMNMALVCLMVVVHLIPDTYSRRVTSPSRIQEVHNSTRNSTIPGPASSPFEGLTPVVITCAVLLQVFLPFFYCGCVRGFKVFCMREEQAQRKRRKQWGESIIDRNEICNPFCRRTSLHFYFSFFLWLVYLVCYNVLDWSKHGAVFKNLHIMSIVVIVFSFLFVLVESLVSIENDHLEHPMQKDDIVDYIKNMREKRPVITMSVECYHSEKRTKSNGNGSTYKKIVTYTGNREFSYDSWEDVSSVEMPWISHSAITRVKIDAFIDFGDKETEEEFEWQKENYYNSFRNFDKEMTFHVHYEIPGLDNRILAYANYSQRTGWISEKYFWFATCCCLTWPYRWLFRAKTEKCRYDIKKKMYAKKVTERDNNSFDMLDFLHSDNYVPPTTGDDAKDSNSILPVVESRDKPLLSMSELPSDATQACLSTNDSSDQEANLLNNQDQPFSATDLEGPYFPTNQGPTDLVNQDPAYPLAKEGAPYVPLLPQEEPDIPPPSYDIAIGQ